MTTHPKIRKHDAFLEDIRGQETISDSILEKWASEDHSVAGHLRMMYGLVRGMQARVIAEVGFGRTSKMLSRAAVENKAVFYSCDRNDHRYAYSGTEMKHIRYFEKGSATLWQHLQSQGLCADFVFLDYFSDKGISVLWALLELDHCLSNVRKGGVVCVHDVADPRYPVSRLPRWVAFLGGIDSLVLNHSQGLLICVKRRERYGIVGRVLMLTLRCGQTLRRVLRKGPASAPVRA